MQSYSPVRRARLFGSLPRLWPEVLYCLRTANARLLGLNPERWLCRKRTHSAASRWQRLQCILILLSYAFILATAFAQDSYVVLDRASYRGLSLVDATAAITCLTPNVPWQHACSLARDPAGSFLVTVNIFAATGHNDGLYRVSLAGEITPVLIGEQFAEPSGVAVDAAGNYVLLNRTWGGSPQILRLSPTGNLELLFEGRPLFVPTDVAIDAGGYYVITDRATRGRVAGAWQYLPENGAVYRFDPLTRQMTTVRSSVDTDGNVKLNDLMGHLTSVAIDRDGNYILVEAPPHLDDDPIGNTYVERMRPDGEILQSTYLPSLDDHYSVGLDVAIDREGNYIVADAVGTTTANGRLLLITPAGQVTSIILTSALGRPGGVVILPASEPPPPRPEIVDLRLVPGAAPPRIRFVWKSEIGRQYRVQRAPTLAGGAWQDLAFTISGTGDFIEFSDQCAGAECGFYRIRFVSPPIQSRIVPNLVSGP